MRKRPLSIVIIALIYFFEPAGNLIQAAFINDMPLFGSDGILSHLLWTDWVILALFPVVAVGIYMVRKWGWYLFISFSGLLIAYNLFVYFFLNPNYAFETILFFILIITGMSAFFLRRHVCAPYFNPRLRWWETAARYRVTLHTDILTEKGALPCETIDISETGCFLECAEPMVEGSSVWVKINCQGAEINVIGKIVRKSGKKDRVGGYGIMFQGMSGETRKTIRQLIFSLERLERQERKDLISASEIPFHFWQRNYTLLSQLGFRIRSTLKHALQNA
jgi:hypothetical protein